MYKQDGVIVHVLESPLPADVKQVIGEVDRDRRRILAAHHTSTHIVNYAARKVLGDHVWQAGAEKTPEKARLDITHYESLTFDQLQEIERVANDLVMKNVPVRTEEISRTEAERRVLHAHLPGRRSARKGAQDRPDRRLRHGGLRRHTRG